MLALLEGYRAEYAATVIVAAFLRGTEGIVHPLLIKAIFDKAVLHGDFGRFVWYAVAYLAFGLAMNTLGLFASLWSASLENRVAKAVSERSLAAFFRTPYLDVLRKGSGYFVARVHGDVHEGVIPLMQAFLETVCQVVIFVAMAGVLIYLSWQATAALAVLVPFVAIASVFLGKKIQALATQEREQEGAVMSTLTKALNSFRIVNGFGLYEKTAAKFVQQIHLLLHTTFRSFRVARTYQAANSATMNVSDFLSMFVGASLVIRGAITFGTYLAFVNTFWRTVTTLMQIMNSVTGLIRLGTIAQRVAKFNDTTMSPPPVTGPGLISTRLAFSYDSDLVLEGVSITVAPAERVLIVGANGSGKTTLANVLAGHLDPIDGNIILPPRVSSVTLPLAFPPIAVADVLPDHVLDSLDPNIDVAMNVDELSSGQQQKVALALALSQDADLYIVDEPLANLDPESRREAMRMLIDKTKGKALVVVMHGFEDYHYLFDRVVDITQLKGEAERSDVGCTDRESHSLVGSHER